MGRKVTIFFLDSSKQIVGSGMLHLMNLLAAIALGKAAQSSGDECEMYWLNIVLDTTLGVAICILLLKITEHVFDYNSGHYGGESSINWEQNPDYRKFFMQILVWCIIVSLMKLAIFGIMVTKRQILVKIAFVATSWLQNSRQRLVFVMIVTPWIMNTFQFVVQDSWLKYTAESRKDEDLAVRLSKRSDECRVSTATGGQSSPSNDVSVA